MPAVSPSFHIQRVRNGKQERETINAGSSKKSTGFQLTLYELTVQYSLTLDLDVARRWIPPCAAARLRTVGQRRMYHELDTSDFPTKSGRDGTPDSPFP
jgi:hypothetical protein